MPTDYETNNKEEHKAIMKDLKDLKCDFNKFELTMTKLMAEMPLRLQEEFDCRYASKETEKFVKKVQWLVISLVIVTLLGLVLTK